MAKPTYNIIHIPPKYITTSITRDDMQATQNDY